MTLAEIEARIREVIPDARAVTVTEVYATEVDHEIVCYWTGAVWIRSRGRPEIVEFKGDPDSLIQAVRVAYASLADPA